MRAVILAAGEGKRMRPLTTGRPKVLLPAGPEPLLHRLLRQLDLAGVRDVTLVTHHGHEAVQASVGDGAAWNLNVRYAPQGAPRGTGHAVAAAKAPADEPLLLLNGDVFLPEGALKRVLDSGPGTVTAAKVADPRQYGVFQMQGGGAAAVVEKPAQPPSAFANAGVYFVPPGFTRLCESLKPSPRGELELTDALNMAFRVTGPWRVVELEDWLDVGRPWDLLAAAERALADWTDDHLGRVEPGATLHGKVFVDEGAVVKAGSYIEGPVYIGKESVIGPNCYLRPNTVVLHKCKVGNASEVKASVLMSGTHVGHLSYVGDSVLGERVNLGAGTLVANLRHDGKTVTTVQEGVKVDTGRRKFGVVLGDGVHTGINTSLNVGVMLPAGASTMPGEVVLKSRV
ncbi:MAG TPA: bifunctional sugar-1-phosphate nucleotidylyltransferase/acetyltransferase [Candidatus Thermoplasmatota archaeon]|nr:bifunctional sugar-1-phosphate nucleotidylyltransferase/acetyltransferase [Candidatus Thermoplasmatota archaeon]